MSIEFVHVGKSFDDKKVLTDLSCLLPEKGVIAVMGRSGSGKSTFINLLLSLIKPDSGKILISPHTRFSAVFQEDRLLMHLSARENLRLTTGRTMSEIHAALTALELDSENPAPVRTYSGGMQRRVSLARGVLFDADVLLLDEPFRGLDEHTRSIAIEWVKHQWRSRLIVLVTHDEEEARRMGAQQVIRIGEDE